MLRFRYLIGLCLYCCWGVVCNLHAVPVSDKYVTTRQDSVNVKRSGRPVSGSTRKGDRPVLFLVGNSTMRTGVFGKGENGQWGWGNFLGDFFDMSKISIENHAWGGSSARTFYNYLWPSVLNGIKKGDWVMIELGHNDGGIYEKNGFRGSIPGTGTDTLTQVREGIKEIVYTYGEYLRRFIRDVKRKGAYPVLLSLTPHNFWLEGTKESVHAKQLYGQWAEQVSREMKVPFIDLNKITSSKFQRFGKWKTSYMFYNDDIHTSYWGAKINAESVVDGIRMNRKLENLSCFLKLAFPEKSCGRNKPTLFVVGDSTAKNKDNGDSQWGWGSVIAEFFDENKIYVENHAVPGASARVFLEEGYWDFVYNSLKPGDFVFIQFGHNDMGFIDSGKERGDLPGTGEESKLFKMKTTGKYRVVYTYGWYLMKFVQDVKEKGAFPVLLTPTPVNKWSDGKILNYAETFGVWVGDIAQRTNAYFIDLNKITGDRLQYLGYNYGLKIVMSYFKGDHTHTSLQGARLNACGVVEGLKKTDCFLKEFLK